MGQIKDLELEESIRLERFISKLWRHRLVIDQLDQVEQALSNFLLA
jgi:hypothetical protein